MIRSKHCLLGMLFVCGGTLFAQQDITVSWRVSLTDLEKRLNSVPQASGSVGEGWRADADSLRASIAAFAAGHPESRIVLPEPLPENPSREAVAKQLDSLKAAVDEVIKKSPGTPFHLGNVEVTVTAEAAPPSPVTDSIDQSEIQDLDLVNVAKALDYLPGVSIQHLANNRNEAGIMVRGFSTRGQVPFYLDGIPISVPYDGYVDFNRFLSSDVAEVQVARGYSSPLLGPNALGGSINLVTQEPVKKVDADALIGTGSGNTLLSSLRLGTRMRRFFVQGSLDWLQLDFVPLSGNFPVYQYKGLPDIKMTDHLNQSGIRDERFGGRVGWTPRASDEYVFSYNNQKGEKGVPLYQSPDTGATFRNFWVWPYWDMDNYYLHSNTGLGETGALRFRAFYSQFRNDIDMYSSDTYNVMNTRNAAHSMYDEYNQGFSTEYSTRTPRRNVISASFFFKEDVHREQGVYPGIAPFPLVEPVLKDSDIQTSIGLQDAIKITSRLSGTVGFSADHFDGFWGRRTTPR